MSVDAYKNTQPLWLKQAEPEVNTQGQTTWWFDSEMINFKWSSTQKSLRGHKTFPPPLTWEFQGCVRLFLLPVTSEAHHDTAGICPLLHIPYTVLSDSFIWSQQWGEGLYLWGTISVCGLMVLRGKVTLDFPPISIENSTLPCAPCAPVNCSGVVLENLEPDMHTAPTQMHSERWQILAFIYDYNATGAVSEWATARPDEMETKCSRASLACK